MSLTIKLSVGALVVAIIVLGAVLLGQGGQKNQRALRAQAIEKSLPDTLNEQLAATSETAAAKSATCVQETDRQLKCVVTFAEADESYTVAGRVTVDPDRDAYIWEAD